MANAVRNHIHLAPTLGESPELAPVWKWKARNRELILNVRAEIVETLGGARFGHVAKYNDTPVRRRDYIYELKIEPGEEGDVFFYIDRLESMLGSYVLLVDHYHAADNTDHTSNVRTMFLYELGSVPPEEPGLNFFYVKVFLKDMEPLS